MKKAFKRAAAALLAALFVFGLTACGGGDEGDLLSQIKSKGKIVIATEGDWSPWTYHDRDGKLVGFDVELGQKIAEKLGVEVEFAETQWDSILEGVSSGRFDIACNGVGYSEERAASMSFSKPYAFPHMVLVVKKDNEDISSFTDLSGKTTANTASSTYASYAESFGATVTPVDDLVQTIELVTAGRVDATLNAEDTVLDYLKQHPDADIKIVAEDEGEQYVIPAAKGDRSKTLIDAIDKIIDELRASGELKDISEKYLGKDITAE